MHRQPKPAEEPFAEPLSVLLDILSRYSCYVDLSIWGPRRSRINETMKGVGMMMGPESTLIHQESKGPPDLTPEVVLGRFPDGDDPAWGLYPPHLIAYADRLQVYNVLFGPRCWALLYWTEVRFRREQLARLRRRESEALGKGNPERLLR